MTLAVARVRMKAGHQHAPVSKHVAAPPQAEEEAGLGREGPCPHHPEVSGTSASASGRGRQLQDQQGHM